MWDTSVGGHVNPGESPADAVRRETEEELGFIPVDLTHLYDYIWESDRECEQVSTYLCRYDGACHPDPEEIVEGRWWPPGEIEGQLSSGIFTPNFIEEYHRYKKNTLSRSTLV